MTPQEKAQLDAQIKEIQDNTKKSENRNGKITLWVIEKVTDAFTLRLGKEYVCILRKPNVVGGR